MIIIDRLINLCKADMSEKKFILNADDFGLSQYHNQAVLEGYVNGFLTSASICANTDAFDSAVNDVLPDCEKLSIGVHLNIIEGKSLTKCTHLTDKTGKFNKSYLYLLLNSHNNNLMKEIEQEFRAQIERVKSCAMVDHIDSHVHIHSIPKIFELVCKLAKEFDIPYVRTQHEKPFFVPSLKKNLNFKLPINLIKLVLLNYLTLKNKKIIKKYNLKTNDYLVGVTYTSMMDQDAIRSALLKIENSAIVECLVHPQKSSYNYNKEFEILKDINLKESILKMGFNLTNYKNT